MAQALLVNIDLIVRIVVPDDATEEQIMAEAANIAQKLSQDIGWLEEGVSEHRPDDVEPFDPESEGEDGRRLVGYQIESTDGTHEIPDGLWSFELFYTRKSADKWLDENNPAGSWKIIPIYDGDVEDATYLPE